MKVTRQYLSGCQWCGAIGSVKELYPTTTGGWSQLCPVCGGSKVITITETEEREEYMLTISEPELIIKKKP